MGAFKMQRFARMPGIRSDAELQSRVSRVGLLAESSSGTIFPLQAAVGKENLQEIKERIERP